MDEGRVSVMFARILVAINDFDQCQAVVDVVNAVAAEGVTQVRALHLRERELSGPDWYARESSGHASFVADGAAFELRMAGLAAGGVVRHALVDRIAEAILAEADLFNADLIVVGHPHRRELTARLFGSVTQRVVHRSRCAVMVAGPPASGHRSQTGSDLSAPGRR